MEFPAGACKTIFFSNNIYITKLLDFEWLSAVQFLVSTDQCKRSYNLVQFTHRIVACDWLLNNWVWKEPIKSF